MKLVQVIAILLAISCASGAKIRQKPSRPAKPAKLVKSRPFQDDWDPDQMCWDDPELYRFADYECDLYYECQEDGSALLFQCDAGTIFDERWEDCFSRDQGAVCWKDDQNSDDCPNSDEVIFLEGENCEDYYICMDGQRVQFFCRMGQHWNAERQYCDNPRTAGCDATAVDIPELPDCMGTADQTLPHPTHCHWFVYCQKNGNRLIQQCPHLFNYDIVSRRCVIQFNATCTEGSKNTGIVPFQKG